MATELVLPCRSATLMGIDEFCRRPKAVSDNPLAAFVSSPHNPIDQAWRLMPLPL